MMKCCEECPGDQTCTHALVCMCGSTMDHSPWDGHTPVSMHDYYCREIEKKVATLLFMEEGPMIKWDGETLFIFDLNPERKLVWKLDPFELIELGKKCIEAGEEEINQ